MSTKVEHDSRTSNSLGPWPVKYWYVCLAFGKCLETFHKLCKRVFAKVSFTQFFNSFKTFSVRIYFLSSFTVMQHFHNRANC
jgi:hypothetical protein